MEATSALTGFHAGLLSWSNWNLEMLAFGEGGKPENPMKTFGKARTNNKFKIGPKLRRQIGQLLSTTSFELKHGNTLLACEKEQITTNRS